jgi:hypothetical protein
MSANIPYDDELTGRVSMTVTGPGGNFVAPNGQKGATKSSSNIFFQFPALVKSDNKGGNWEDIQTMMAEPFAFYKGGTPREIDVSFTYIITGQTHGSSGIKWGTGNVQAYVKSLRGYFYNQAGADLIIRFWAYDIVGSTNDHNDKDWTFRSDSVSVSHSGPIIFDGDGFYPLRTDVSMKLKFLINGALGDNGAAYSAASQSQAAPAGTGVGGFVGRQLANVASGAGLSVPGAGGPPGNSQPKVLIVDKNGNQLLKPIPTVLDWF